MLVIIGVEVPGVLLNVWVAEARRLDSDLVTRKVRMTEDSETGFIQGGGPNRVRVLQTTSSS